jgi:hypothetical protein
MLHCKIRTRVPVAEKRWLKTTRKQGTFVQMRPQETFEASSAEDVRRYATTNSLHEGIREPRRRRSDRDLQVQRQGIAPAVEGKEVFRHHPFSSPRQTACAHPWVACASVRNPPVMMVLVPPSLKHSDMWTTAFRASLSLMSSPQIGHC